MEQELFAQGIEALKSRGYQLKVMPHAQGYAQGYLAASAEDRAADLMQAWLDPETDLVLCSRGGYGCMHLLPLLDWDTMRSRPDLPLCGFSDVTALLCAMDRLQVGIPVAGPMLRYFAGNEAQTVVSFEKAFSGESVDWSHLEALNPGHAKGWPLGCNLTVLSALAGTKYLPDAAGRIVVLEEVREAPYRIDRTLTQLELCGFFRGCAGVVFGHFTECGGAEELLVRWAGRQKFPVRKGLPFGHELPSVSINFHCEAHF